MRGVEAPFQLMVSVVAMVMVLGLAYLVLSHTMKEDCNNKWEIQLRNIAGALSTVMQGSAPTKLTVSFDLRCGDATSYWIQVKEEDDPNICLRVCGSVGRTGRCGILRFEANKPSRNGETTVGTVNVCIDGMGYVNWERSDCEGCNNCKNITNDILNGMDFSNAPGGRPFGTLVIEKLLKDGEPVAICRIR